jgi:Cytochrome P460
MKAKFLAALAVGALTASAIGVRAANDQFTFPSNFAEGVEYLTVDKPNKQVHVFFAPQAAIEAAKAGKPMPEGTVFTGVHYNAKLDKDGNPEKDANGRFIKGDLRQFAVMRKEKGWGAEYPAEKRNGDWEYRIFTKDHAWNDKVQAGVCLDCHLPKASQDFVWSYDALKAAGK